MIRFADLPMPIYIPSADSNEVSGSNRPSLQMAAANGKSKKRKKAKKHKPFEKTATTHRYFAYVANGTRTSKLFTRKWSVCESHPPTT